MDNDERFEEIDGEIKIKLAELWKCAQNDNDSSSLAQRRTQMSLKEVDQQVNTNHSANDMAKQIKALEELVQDIPTSQRSKYIERIRSHETERNNLVQGLVSRFFDYLIPDAGKQFKPVGRTDY